MTDLINLLFWDRKPLSPASKLSAANSSPTITPPVSSDRGSVQKQIKKANPSSKKQSERKSRGQSKKKQEPISKAHTGPLAETYNNGEDSSDGFLTDYHNNKLWFTKLKWKRKEDSKSILKKAIQRKGRTHTQKITNPAVEEVSWETELNQPYRMPTSICLSTGSPQNTNPLILDNDIKTSVICQSSSGCMSNSVQKTNPITCQASSLCSGECARSCSLESTKVVSSSPCGNDIEAVGPTINFSNIPSSLSINIPNTEYYVEEFNDIRPQYPEYAQSDFKDRILPTSLPEVNCTGNH